MPELRGTCRAANRSSIAEQLVSDDAPITAPTAGLPSSQA